MERPKIQAQKRTRTGSVVSKAMRKSGRLPAVVYGVSVPGGTIDISLDNYEFERAIALNSVGGLFDLHVEGQIFPVSIAEIHKHPVKRTFYNVDFHQIEMDVVQTFRVPVVYVGTPIGVKAGGILETQSHHVDIACLPTVLPESIEHDISEQDIGVVVYASELKLPEGVELKSDPMMVLTTMGSASSKSEEEVEVKTEQEEKE